MGPSLRRARLAVLAFGLCGLCLATEQVPQAPPAPVLSLPDLDGNPVALTGGVTSLYFLATWCAPCLPPLAGIERTTVRYGHRGYRALVIGVATREDRDSLRDFVRRRGLELPVLFDAEQAAERAYGVKALPWHVLIGADGTIREQGPVVPDDLMPRVDALLQEKSP